MTIQEVYNLLSEQERHDAYVWVFSCYTWPKVFEEFKPNNWDQMTGTESYPILMETFRFMIQPFELGPIR